MYIIRSSRHADMDKKLLQHRLVYQVYNEPVCIDDIEYEGTIKVVRM